MQQDGISKNQWHTSVVRVISGIFQLQDKGPGSAVQDLMYTISSGGTLKNLMNEISVNS